MRTINRLNFAIAVVSLLAVGVLYLWLRTLPIAEPQAEQEADTPAVAATETPIEQAATIDTADAEAAYQEEVNALLSDFQFDDSARAAELSEDVLKLRTPAAFKELHVQIVVILQDVQNGNTAEAQDRIDTLQNEYPWFLQ